MKLGDACRHFPFGIDVVDFEQQRIIVQTRIKGGNIQSRLCCDVFRRNLRRLRPLVADADDRVQSGTVEFLRDLCVLAVKDNRRFSFLIKEQFEAFGQEGGIRRQRERLVISGEIKVFKPCVVFAFDEVQNTVAKALK